MQNEIWKKIENYDNYYISNRGNVLNIYEKAIKRNSKEKGIAFKILKPIKDTNGYYCVSLYKNKSFKNYKIHRLVAEAFIPNKRNYNQINHKDENKSNNQVENLEWCNSKYNNNYGSRKNRASKKMNISVSRFDNEGKLIKKYDSIQSVKKDGFDPSKVCSICKNKYGRKTHKGYIWKYNL